MNLSHNQHFTGINIFNRKYITVLYFFQATTNSGCKLKFWTYQEMNCRHFQILVEPSTKPRNCPGSKVPTKWNEYTKNCNFWVRFAKQNLTFFVKCQNQFFCQTIFADELKRLFTFKISPKGTLPVILYKLVVNKNNIFLANLFWKNKQVLSPIRISPDSPFKKFWYCSSH